MRTPSCLRTPSLRTLPQQTGDTVGALPSWKTSTAEAPPLENSIEASVGPGKAGHGYRSTVGNDDDLE